MSEEKKLEQLEKELEELKKQADEYLAGWKRAKADLVNFQKEMERQKETWVKFAHKDLVLSLLPLCDNFHEAVKYADGEDKNNFIEGVLQIKKQVDGLLLGFGVERMEALGEKFNPEFHESVGLEESENMESGKVIRVIQAGYKLNDKVLRPPKVIIAK